MSEEQGKQNQIPDSSEALSWRLQQLLDEDWSPDEPRIHTMKPAEQPPEEPEQPRPSSRKRNRGEGVCEQMLMFHDLVYILAVVVLLFTFFIRMSRVEGDSMYPTLVHHDRMLLLSSVWYQNPEPGDIVVARIPAFSRDPIVKRVIATEGDTVDIDFENGIVYVNGEVLEEDYINELTTRQFYEEGLSFPVTVEDNHVFLMGDNRNDSYDSRYASIGLVDCRQILGKALMIVFPGADETTDSRFFSRLGPVG